MVGHPRYFCQTPVQSLESRLGVDFVFPLSLVARLRGLAAVCDLNIETKCTCGNDVKVSAVDSWILLLLVKNLYDSDIRQEVMSKVTVMTLDETIAFVEAKEASLKATCNVTIFIF